MLSVVSLLPAKHHQLCLVYVFFAVAAFVLVTNFYLILALMLKKN